MLATGATETIDLPGIAAQITLAPQEVVDIATEEDVSPIYQHASHVQMHRDEARQLPDDISSAKTYKGVHPIVYVLMLYGEKYVWAVYNLQRRVILSKTDVELLNMISCSETTPTAFVEPDDIERAASRCVRRWCRENTVEESAVRRVCTLLLKPESSGDSPQGHAARRSRRRVVANQAFSLREDLPRDVYAQLEIRV